MKIILLIDDDKMIRMAFGAALRIRGYKVIEADSGESGLELARQQMPDLILSDIHMPGGDGEALLQHIRADPALCSKQVVLMTGRPDLVPPRRVMEQGADDFLVKPVTMDALLSCVEMRLKRGDVHWRVEDRVLSTLQSSISSCVPHEFFTPLAGILGLSDILQSDFASLSTAEIQGFHRDIHQSAQRLQRTLTNYLLLLELQAASETKETPPPALSPAELGECLTAAVTSIGERHNRQDDVTIRGQECAIRVDPADLNKIVEELVDNALKFSRAKTPVEVEIEAGGVLRVTDGGRGMSDGEISQVGAFQQFERKKFEHQGLGLGLALVQKLAAKNGASFSLKRGSEKGIEARIQFQVG